MLSLLCMFLQTGSGTSIPEYGVSTGIAGFVIYLWRQDRKDRDIERKLQEQRYQTLAEDFRRIVQDNTAAITSLKDSLLQRTVQCPLLAQREFAMLPKSGATPV
jgi:hypothetical protein